MKIPQPSQSLGAPQLLYKFHSLFNQSVMGAAASFLGAAKDTFIHKVQYVAQGGGGGSVCHLCPFAGVEFALESIPKPVDDLDLPFIQRNGAVLLPKQ